MNISITMPKDLLKRLHDVNKMIVEPVMVGYATAVQHEITSNKPSPPKRGGNKFVSDKQRKFVMAGIRDGSIDSPYRRGFSRQSERLNRSYRIIRAPSTVTLTNSASYMQYVIGDKQAKIHKDRWLTGRIAAGRVDKSGIIKRLVRTAVRKQFP